MGQRANGACRCGACAYPPAYGVLPTLLIDVLAYYGETHYSDVTSAGNAWKNIVGGYRHASLTYTDEPMSRLLEARYLASRGFKSKLDGLILGSWDNTYNGYTPGLTWNSIPRTTEEIDTVNSWLNDGGLVVMILEGFNGDANNWFHGDFAGDVATFNSWLSSVGSSVTLRTDADLVSTYSIPVTTSYRWSYRPIYTGKRLSVYNPNTWLTQGKEYLPLMIYRNEWGACSLLDIRRQFGGPPSGNFALTDVKAGGDGVIDYVHSTGDEQWGLQNVYITTTDATCVALGTPTARMVWPSLTQYPPATHASTPTGAGYTFTNLITGTLQVSPTERRMWIRATAETLPSGGRLLILSDRVSGGHTMRILHYHLSPSCRNLSKSTIPSHYQDPEDWTAVP